MPLMIDIAPTTQTQHEATTNAPTSGQVRLRFGVIGSAATGLGAFESISDATASGMDSTFGRSRTPIKLVNLRANSPVVLGR
jgi:hypothetical protein